MKYSLLMPHEVRFGWGVRSELPDLVAQFGQRAFLVTGGSSLEASGHLAAITAAFVEADMQVEMIRSSGSEPTIAMVDEATAHIVGCEPREGDVVVGLGGGAVMDLAKALAAMATNAGGRSIREYLEGVGSGLELLRTPLPVIAVPTTAGTGSEATKNAVISVNEPPCKKSLRSTHMMPRVALIDPEFTVSCPPHITAWSGMDAITQLIESFLSQRANSFSQMLCLEGLPGSIRALRTAFVDGENRMAREFLSHAAFLSGLALANSGLGFAHGVAAALGSTSHVPHGLACAVLLPVALRVNRDACRDQFPLLASALIPGNSSQDPYGAVEQAIVSLLEDLRIPLQLRELGVAEADLPAIAEGSMGNSMSGNPVPMTPSDVLNVLENCW